MRCCSPALHAGHLFPHITSPCARRRSAAPRFGERVRFVVVAGQPGARLMDLVAPPATLVESGGRLRLHATYYITKQINPGARSPLHWSSCVCAAGSEAN